MSSGDPGLMDEARGWLSDCQWADDEIDFDAMPADQVRAGVERHYDGGWAAFRKAGPEPAPRARTQARSRDQGRRQETRTDGRAPR